MLKSLLIPTIYSLVCYRYAYFQQWEMQHYFLITYSLFLLTREMFHSPDMEHYTAFRYIPGRYLTAAILLFVIRLLFVIIRLETIIRKDGVYVRFI